jgi:hypothetical protein
MRLRYSITCTSQQLRHFQTYTAENYTSNSPREYSQLKSNSNSNSKKEKIAQSLRKIASHKDVYPAISLESFDPADFKDKVVLVTDSRGGIGKATSLAFSQLGSKVAFTDLRIEIASAAAKEATE